HQLQQQRAQEPHAHHHHSVAFPHTRAPVDVDRTRNRLAQDRPPRKRRRDLHHRVRPGHVVLREPPVAQCRHDVAGLEPHDARTHLLHHPVHLVPRRPRIERVPRPLDPFPGPQIPRTHPASVDLDQHLPDSRRQPVPPAHPEPPRPPARRCRRPPPRPLWFTAALPPPP